MTVMNLLIVLWSVTVALFVMLMVYRGHLGHYDSDQLFLSDDESMSNEHVEHEAVVRKIRRIQPLCNVGAVATLVLTVAIVGTWTYGVVQTGHF